MSLLETDEDIRRKIYKFMQELYARICALVKYEAIIIEKINRENF